MIVCNSSVNPKSNTSAFCALLRTKTSYVVRTQITNFNYYSFFRPYLFLITYPITIAFVAFLVLLIFGEDSFREMLRKTPVTEEEKIKETKKCQALLSIVNHMRYFVSYLLFHSYFCPNLFIYL